MSELYNVATKAKNALMTEYEFNFYRGGWWCKARENCFNFGNPNNTWAISAEHFNSCSKNGIQLTSETPEDDIISAIGEQVYRHFITFFYNVSRLYDSRTRSLYETD
jgi:hypothetical protein